MNGVTTAIAEERLTDTAERLIVSRVDKKFKNYFAVFAIVGSLGLISFVALLEGRIEKSIIKGVEDETKVLRDNTLLKLSDARAEADSAIVRANTSVDKTKAAETQILEVQAQLSSTLIKVESENERLEIISEQITGLLSQVEDFSEGDTTQQLQILSSIAKGLKEDDAAERLLSLEQSFNNLKQEIPQIVQQLQSSQWRNPNLLNGWVPYGNNYGYPKYTKDSNGGVHLSGLVKSGENNKAIFNLPEGMRPAARVIFSTLTHPNIVSRIDITETGDVMAMTSNVSWVSLSGISFISEQ